MVLMLLHLRSHLLFLVALNLHGTTGIEYELLGITVDLENLVINFERKLVDFSLSPIILVIRKIQYLLLDGIMIPSIDYHIS